VNRLATLLLPLAALLLAACGDSRLDATLIDYENQGDGQVPYFEPPAGWSLAYTWDCSTERSQNPTVSAQFAFVVFNADDTSLASEHPTLQREGLKGSGTLHYARGGAYYIRVTSPCDWRIKTIKEVHP